MCLIIGRPAAHELSATRPPHTILAMPTPPTILDRRVPLLGEVRRAFVLATIALAGIALTVVLLTALLQSASAWVAHSRELSRIARAARALALDRETGLRGYLLTGDRASLAPAIAAQMPLRERLDSLAALTTDKPAQHARALAIAAALDAWEREVAMPALASPKAARGIAVLDLAGKPQFDAVRRAFAAFIATEETLYTARASRDRWLERLGIAAVLAELAILALVLAAWRGRLQGQAARLDEQQSQLEEQAQELEEQAMELEQQLEQTQTMAAELESANQELGAALDEAMRARADAADAERRTEESETLLDVALANAPLGFAFFDRAGRFRRVNGTLARLDGVPADAHIGHTVGELFPSLAPSVEPVLAEVLATGQPVLGIEMTGELASTPGRVWHNLVSYFPVRGASGNVVGAGVMVLDTTERKLLELQLQQAQKMEAIGRLAGGVAHDFNNLLTVIKSYSTILLGSLEGRRAKADVEEIDKAASRAASLTAQLLAFSRKQVLRPRVLDLALVVQNVEAMLRRLIGADVQLIIANAPDLGLVRADPGQLEQVLMNLVINARDAMPEGGAITIETANAELSDDRTDRHIGVAPGDYVMLAVSDDGIGMSNDTMARIFEPFFTTKEKGTGLGLSTVYGIVKQSGGDIWVYSERGRGTTFKIYLPRIVDGDSEAASAAASMRGAVRGAESVLLVDDDAALRALARRVLASAGYDVHDARDGAEALAILDAREGHIQLLLTDLVMPGIGGRELAERAAARAPALRVLFVSGYTDDDVLRRGMVDARTAFLQKPFSPELLLRRVREVLDAVPA